MEFSWSERGGHAALVPSGCKCRLTSTFVSDATGLPGCPCPQEFTQRWHFAEMTCCVFRGYEGAVKLRHLFWPPVGLEGNCEFVSNGWLKAESLSPHIIDIWGLIILCWQGTAPGLHRQDAGSISTQCDNSNMPSDTATCLPRGWRTPSENH